VEFINHIWAVGS